MALDRQLPAELITSRRNPLVKRLRELHAAKGRREQGLVLLEGTHLVQEVIRLQLVTSKLKLSHLLATEAWIWSHGDLVAALSPAVTIQPVGQEVLEAVATTAHPDGVVLTLATAALQAPPEGQEFVLVLDTLQDPGNLGTLMRTALAAGVDGLWLAEGADPFQPKVLRASAGAALALSIERMDRSGLVQRLITAAARGLQLVAAVPPLADLDGQQPVAYWHLDWTKPTALLLGQEGAGLAPELQALASHRITIPHSAAVESLNVAVSAAPLLLERRRQQAQR